MDFPFEFAVDDTLAGRRLDAAIAERVDGFSRAVLKRSIDSGAVTVDGEPRKASYKLSAGQRVAIARVEPPPPGPEPEAIPLDLLHEDDDLVAVNKPAGMVVHPAKGHWAGTLASALAHHFGESLSGIGGPTRPGIVHRLDRDTTGVIVVAKNDRAHENLAAQFKARTTEKHYLAIVVGVPDRDADVIDQPIGAHPSLREKMAIRAGHPTSREAVTRYEVVERFERHALVRCYPKTGRTHQIRVHLTFAGYPILCDKLYGDHQLGGARELMPRRGATELRQASEQATREQARSEPAIARQALHAERLRIDHPTTGERLDLEAPAPRDIQQALSLLRGLPNGEGV